MRNKVPVFIAFLVGFLAWAGISMYHSIKEFNSFQQSGNLINTAIEAVISGVIVAVLTGLFLKFRQ